MFDKRSSEEFFRYHNFTKWLDAPVVLTSGEVIVTDKATEADVSETMVSDVSVFESKKVIYKIKGGSSGKVYRVTIRATDSNGQKWEDQIDCKVL